MGKAKDILLRPIPAAQANDLVKRIHYSGKVVQNSQIHIGVFYDGRLEGAMQFGPSLDKRKIQGLVSGTAWHEFIELNRMAFSEALPRNSESRAIAIAMRLLKQHAPQIKWVISFADGTQCGDGTIYRASGFVLTGIRENNQIWIADGGAAAVSRTAMTAQGTKGASKQKREILSRVTVTKGQYIAETGAASMQPFIAAGYKPLKGFQIRYIYFIDPTYRQRLTVPELPYSEIERMGARMYKGQRLQAAGAADVAPDDQSGKGGLIPTPPLHSLDELTL
jgi:hypothetical protein